MASNIFKRSDRPGYHIEVMHNGRRVKRGAFATQQAAQIALAKVRRELARGDLGLEKRSQIPFEDLARKRYIPWAKNRKRDWKKDQQRLESVILPQFKGFTVSDITKDRVESFLNDLIEDGRAPSTANRYLALIRKMLNLAVDWNLIDTNPLKGIQPFKEAPERAPTMNPEDEARLLEACQPWLKDIVQAALLTGARQGELLALQWTHVDFKQNLLTFEDSKSGNPRRIPLHPVLAAQLQPRRGLPRGHVFTLDDGTPIKRHTCSQAFRRIVRRLDLDLRFHDLRHIAATRMMSSGAGLLQLSSILGHKTLAMTRRYSHVSMDDMRKAMEGLGE